MAHRGKWLTAEEKQRIIDLDREGVLSVDDIAEEVWCSSTTVYTTLRDAGRPRNWQSHSGGRKRKKVVVEYLEGKRPVEIARKIKRPEGTVRNWLREAGVLGNRRPGPIPTENGYRVIRFGEPRQTTAGLQLVEAVQNKKRRPPDCASCPFAGDPLCEDTLRDSSLMLPCERPLHFELSLEGFEYQSSSKYRA